MDYNAYQFGAAGDGKAMDTLAVQKAIDACSQNGGGRAVLSKGTFKVGTLFMKSNVELHIEVDATLLGSGEIADYPSGTHYNMYYGESHMDRCLIFSNNVENISLTGRGTINGQGELFPAESSRPMMLRFLNSKNIRFNSLKLRNPASWTNAFIGCADIWVDGIDIRSRVNYNGDGLDFDSCENVFVSNCKLDCSDDCICLQNSEETKKCTNIVITNTLMISQFAGIRIGPLSCGNIENVTVSNCVFKDINCSGLKIQSSEGGTYQNMLFNNLIMDNVPRPVYITLNHFRFRVDRDKAVPLTGRIRNLQFSNIRAISKAHETEGKRAGFVIDGLSEHCIENINLTDIYYTANGGGTEEEAKATDIPDILNKRPEGYVYGPSLPSYGIFARHVRNLKLRNVQIDTALPDARPDIYCEDCTLDNE